MDNSTCFFEQFTSLTWSDADLVLLVTLDNNSSDPSLAWASSCKFDLGSFRTIGGQVNLNLAYGKPKDVNDDKFSHMIQTTVAHEITHAVGFNPGLFDRFQTKELKTLGIPNIVKDPNTTAGHYFEVKTPKVLEMAKDHFNCSTMQGLELEQSGEPGSKDAHWE